MAEEMTRELAEEQINRLLLSEKLGIQITIPEKGYSEGRLKITDLHRNTVGSVHGGILFSLADSTAGAAAKSLGHVVTTAQCNIQYMKRALGTEIVCKGRVIRAGRTLIWADAEMYNDQDELVCRANIQFFIIG